MDESKCTKCEGTGHINGPICRLCDGTGRAPVVAEAAAEVTEEVMDTTNHTGDAGFAPTIRLSRAKKATATT